MTSWTTKTTFKGSLRVQTLPPPPPPKKNAAKETKFIQDLANSYDEDDATGDEIQKELADVAQKRGTKRLSSEKIESFVEKYRQPQNCSDVKGIKVKPEIWSQLTSKQRKKDLKISNLQQIIRRTTLATLKTTSMLINNSSVPDTNEIMAQQVGTIAILGHVNTQLAQLQIDEIKPSLKAE